MQKHRFNADLHPAANVIEQIQPLLDIAERHEGATEICVNQPGEVFIQHGPHWSRHAEPFLTHPYMDSLCTAIASYTAQTISNRQPLLSADLPGGQRIQIVRPPAVSHGEFSLTIRIPSQSVIPLDSYHQTGVFSDYQWIKHKESEVNNKGWNADDLELYKLIEKEKDLMAFFTEAVIQKRTIAFVGDTGSGKTSLMKTLCQYIPKGERIITIEDVRELFLPTHENRVHMLYSKGGQGTADVSPSTLIHTSMRMLPSRVLMAELRGAEAYDMLKLLTTGHRGSITSFHADSAALAFDRFVFMCKEHPDAQVYTAAELKSLCALTFDIIAHIEVRDVLGEDSKPIRRERRITQVYFDPSYKRKQAL